MSNIENVIIDADGMEGEILVPRPDQSVVAVAPPGDGPGYWAGAPSAVWWAGDVYLAYRLRRPLGRGRGYAVVVARSGDGEQFETLVTITKEEMRAESLERPALVRTPDGIWRLYLSCGTFGTKHWRGELLEASSPSGFDVRQTRVALPGDVKTAVKDPVIVCRDLAPVGVVPPAGEPRGDGPDGHRPRHQSRRLELDLGRHRAGRAGRAVGRTRRQDQRGPVRAGRARGLLRRPRDRRGELRGAHRGGGRPRAHRADCADHDPARPVALQRRRPALPGRPRASRRPPQALLRDDQGRRRARAAHRAALGGGLRRAALPWPFLPCRWPLGLPPTRPPDRSLGRSQKLKSWPVTRSSSRMSGSNFGRTRSRSSGVSGWRGGALRCSMCSSGLVRDAPVVPGRNRPAAAAIRAALATVR